MKLETKLTQSLMILDLALRLSKIAPVVRKPFFEFPGEVEAFLAANPGYVPEGWAGRAVPRPLPSGDLDADAAALAVSNKIDNSTEGWPLSHASIEWGNLRPAVPSKKIVPQHQLIRCMLPPTPPLM